MPLTYQQRSLERLQRRIEELRSWRNAREVTIPDWLLIGDDGHSHIVQLGDRWPVIAEPVHLTATAPVPEGWEGQEVELELALGGEGLVKLSTGYQSGLNPFHHRFPVWSSATAGDLLTIDAEVMPKGLMGSHINRPTIDRAMLVVPHREIRAFERDLTMLREAVIQLSDHDVAPLLLDAAADAISELTDGWPSASEVLVSRYVLGYEDGIGGDISFEEDDDWIPEASDIRRPKRRTWSYPQTAPLTPMPSEGVAAVVRARESLQASLKAISQTYPAVGSLCLTGHAHIDLAWLWPLAETRRKTRRTFSSVLDLMERYDDFTFNQSSAQVYEWIADDDPAVFERIRQRIAEGRWEPIGGMWVESDANIPSGESFARQLAYGQRYFEETFGIRNKTVWLPDVFGYSGGLPQIMRGAGITGFFTTKLNWSENNQFPYDLFTWEGIDGSTITVHTFFNPGHGYNGNIAPLDTLGTWKNFRGKTLHGESLLSFGWGDGAGGPSEKMLENYLRLRDFPVLPRLHMGRIEEYFASLPETGLPRFTGELYLELHRGTLTSQARTKQLNRHSEHRLLEAEAFGAIASMHGFDYAGLAIERAWKDLLLNQFHDILPGSSINEVYQDTHRMLDAVVETATAERNRALESLPGEAGAGWVVANPSINARPFVTLLPDAPADATLVDASGSALISQPAEGGVLVASTSEVAPGLGWKTVRSGSGATSGNEFPAVTARTLRSGLIALENEHLRVDIGKDGTIEQIADKQAERDVLSAPGNQLWLYIDRPYTYDAWDIDETYERDGWQLTDAESVEVIESGPIRASVRVVRKYEGSTIEQVYSLWSGSRRIDIETSIDWRQRQLLLKARMPLAIRTHEATYETMYGAIRRPTHRNTSWDAAKFEVAGHRFADMSEPGYGVALLNDAKYGYEANGNVLSLTLLRSPLFPDPMADEGHHHFTYSLYPHIGDWTEAGVSEEAFRLNSPLVARPADALPADQHFVEVSGLPVGLGALKPAFDGDGLVLRIYEPNGARGRARLTFTSVVSNVGIVNLLEEPDTRKDSVAQINPVTLDVDLQPFEIVTLRLGFGS
ncbi:MAG: alpha-mannosidase [Thermomicrobiales bacterium]|nr:alpha-mannosidase [Thermomicrobiales bacterium]